MLKRIKRAWEGFNGPEARKPLLIVNRSAMRPEEFQKLTREVGEEYTVIASKETAQDFRIISGNRSSEGDGKTVFFGEGTEQEFKDQQDEDKGLKGIFGL